MMTEFSFFLINYPFKSKTLCGGIRILLCLHPNQPDSTMIARPMAKVQGGTMCSVDQWYIRGIYRKVIIFEMPFGTARENYTYYTFKQLGYSSKYFLVRENKREWHEGEKLMTELHFLWLNYCLIVILTLVSPIVTINSVGGWHTTKAAVVLQCCSSPVWFPLHPQSREYVSAAPLLLMWAQSWPTCSWGF